MVASVFIIVVSAALLLYWFRYTSLLILRTRTAKDYATSLVLANKLEFREIQSRGFSEVPVHQLAAVEDSLARDYRLLTYLLQHTAGLDIGGFTLEQRLLMADFMVMRMFARLSRSISTSQSRAALEEMSQVLYHLANAMGERIQSSSRA